MVKTKKVHDTILLYMRIRALLLFSSTISNVANAVIASCSHMPSPTSPLIKHIKMVYAEQMGSAHLLSAILFCILLAIYI